MFRYWQKNHELHLICFEFACPVPGDICHCIAKSVSVKVLSLITSVNWFLLFCIGRIDRFESRLVQLPDTKQFAPNKYGDVTLYCTTDVYLKEGYLLNIHNNPVICNWLNKLRNAMN
jgi:hypothetical protein